MSKINELRAQRAKTWEQTKAFLDSHRSDKGVLTAEDTATYEKMEQEIVDLGREIERQERLDAFERELNTPVNTPITQKPDTAKVDTKTGRASDAYKKAFWAQARTKGGMLTAEIRNALQEGVDSEGFTHSEDEVLASVRVYREGRHGSQRWANLAAFSEATDLFRFRCIPGLTVTTDQFLICDDCRYDIMSVEDVKGRGMYIELLAKKEVPTVG